MTALSAHFLVVCSLRDSCDRLFLTLFQNQKTLLIPGGKLFISFSVSVSCLWHEIEYRIRLYWMAACDRSVQTEISEQLLHGFRWTFGDSPCFLMVYPHNTDDPLTFSGVPQWGCNDVFLVKYLKYLNVGMTAIKFGTEIHVPLKMDCIDVGWYSDLSLARSPTHSTKIVNIIPAEHQHDVFVKQIDKVESTALTRLWSITRLTVPCIDKSTALFEALKYQTGLWSVLLVLLHLVSTIFS